MPLSGVGRATGRKGQTNQTEGGNQAGGVQDGGDDSGQMGWGQEQHELLYQMFAVGKWENGGSGAKGEFRMMEDVEGGEGSTVAPGLSVVRGEGAGMAN